jgi:hypothetical protein
MRIAGVTDIYANVRTLRAAMDDLDVVCAEEHAVLCA